MSKHTCRECGYDYACGHCAAGRTWMCPALNDDEEGCLCDYCLDKFIAELDAWWRTQPPDFGPYKEPG